MRNYYEHSTYLYIEDTRYCAYPLFPPSSHFRYEINGGSSRLLTPDPMPTPRMSCHQIPVGVTTPLPTGISRGRSSQKDRPYVRTDFPQTMAQRRRSGDAATMQRRTVVELGELWSSLRNCGHGSDHDQGRGTLTHACCYTLLLASRDSDSMSCYCSFVHTCHMI